MPSITFRIIDAATFEVLSDVGDEASIAAFLLANGRYVVNRRPMKGVTIIETNANNLNVPGQ